MLSSKIVLGTAGRARAGAAGDTAAAFSTHESPRGRFYASPAGDNTKGSFYHQHNLVLLPAAISGSLWLNVTLNQSWALPVVFTPAKHLNSQVTTVRLV